MGLLAMALGGNEEKELEMGLLVVRAGDGVAGDVRDGWISFHA